MNLEIALVQFAVAPSDPLQNLARMETFIQQAAENLAQLVVFPEDAVTGPLSGQTGFVQYAPQYLSAFQGLAVKYGVDLVPGTWSVSDGVAAYNTAYYINKDGSVGGVYRKINLWDSERALVTPGTAVSVFRTRHGVVGLAICWDLSFPALFQEAKALGAELVVVPAYWAFGAQGAPTEQMKGTELIDALCTARAFENDLLIAYCNATGTLHAEGVDAVLSGRSQIVHPTLGAQCRATANEEQILQCRI
ncbi:MAG: carbon-nitrogen hydrolase family protein [Burkholderiales bacterium]